MSMRNYEEANRLIEENGGGDFVGPRTVELVAHAEAALDLAFPPTYRRFLLEHGCGNFGSSEIFGLIDENFSRSTVPNGIWATLDLRRLIRLDPNYVVIADMGEGSFYCLDTRILDDDREAPVVFVSLDGKFSERIADSFGSFLLEQVERGL